MTIENNEPLIKVLAKCFVSPEQQANRIKEMKENWNEG